MSGAQLDASKEDSPFRARATPWLRYCDSEALLATVSPHLLLKKEERDLSRKMLAAPKRESIYSIKLSEALGGRQTS